MLSIIRTTELNQEIYDSIVRLWSATGISNPARSDSFKAIQQSLKHTGILLTAWEDDSLLGTLWLSHDYRRLYAHHMAVLPSRQSSGIGSELMQEAVQVAKELGYQMKLEVHAENLSAIHLYKKFGFKELAGYLTLIKRDI
ncbi:MAG: GNAT family N-acetyltransferase [Candidatus Cloacimonetes bacterium]|nr:GNAT family N-acetyltransferase [Candidatus Cloacimonadota bacterium]